MPMTRSIRVRTTSPVGAAFAFVAASVSPIAAQSASSPASPSALAGAGRPLATDTSGLGSGPNARMSMLLEKTFLSVDILRVEFRLGPEETRRVDRLLASRDANPEALRTDVVRDSIAAIALAAEDAWARIEFQRNVGLDRFLDGVRGNMRLATRAGLMTPEAFRRASEDLPNWYAFLEDRGIRGGDRMYYRVRGDSLHTAFVSADGATLLDQTDVGPDPRRTLLGSYFAPGTDFREPLVESLLDRD